MRGDNSMEELGLPGNSNELGWNFEEHHPLIFDTSSLLSIAKQTQRVTTYGSD